MYKFSGDKYSRAEEALDSIRGRSMAVRKARGMISGSNPTWLAENAGGQKLMLGEGGNTIKIIEKLRQYLRRSCVGSLSTLLRTNIGVSYMVVGDIARKAVLGENTSGLRGNFDWEYMFCTVKTYAGEMTRLEPLRETNMLLQMQPNDRKKIQQATGWDVPGTQQMMADDVHTLVTLLTSASAGQNKITRLVKGMLLYIDMVRNGRQHFAADINRIIQYNPNNVLRSFRAQGRSYAYCSKTSQAYVALLYLMGLEYPPNFGGIVGRGVVNIPADAEEHWIVANSNIGPGGYRCDLTQQLVWIGVVNYAKEMGIADLIEEALVIACSLYENRYIRECGLPRVESTLDLIRPAFVMSRMDNSLKPVIDEGMAVATGRCHQMSMLLVIKDMIIAAQASSSAGYDYSRIMRSYLTIQEGDITRMSQATTPVSLLAATAKMRWLSYLNDDDISDLGGISILEGLWLCDSKTRSVERGGIDLLARGKNDMIGNNGYINLLTSECQKINIQFDRNKIPYGRYSVVGRCIYSTEEWDGDQEFFKKFEVQLRFPCDYKPPERKEVCRIRFSDLRPKNSPKVSSSSRWSEEVVVPTKPKVVEAVVTPLEYGADNDIDTEVVPIEPKHTVKAPSTIKKESKTSVDLKFGFKPAGRSPTSSWAKPPKLEVDTNYEDELYKDVEKNKDVIAVSGKPKKKELMDRWESIRILKMFDGEKLEPITDKEKAFMHGPLYDGPVDPNWDKDILRGIVSSVGWSNTLSKMGINLSEKVFGDDKSYYYGYIISETNGNMQDIKNIDRRFSNTTINIRPEYAVKHLVQYTAGYREMKGGDSMSTSKRTREDGLVANALLEIPGMCEEISNSQLKSIKNNFRFSKFELAKLRVTVSE